MRTPIILTSAALALLFTQPALAQERLVNITIKTDNNTVITATMENSATAKDFLTLLPLTLVLKDYHQTEKVSDLPKKLTRQGAPATITPKTGDIAYYAPWGNLAIFYRDFDASPGLIKLGTITSGIAALQTSNASGNINVTIDIAK